MRIYTFLSKKVGDLTKKYSNLPESYIKRSYEQVYWKNPSGYPQYPRAVVQRKKYRFTTNRPWTFQFRQQNEPMTHRKKVFLEPVGEWSFFKGDRVEIMVGPDKGKQGIINQVIQERNWVIVEGLNTHLRTVGKEKNFPGVLIKSEAPLLVTTGVRLVDPETLQPTEIEWRYTEGGDKVGKEKNFPGVLIKSEAPLLVTTGVRLVDPETLQPTEIEWRYTEGGDKVRVSQASSRIIPIPKQNEETVDYKSKAAYIESQKDTTAETIAEITFKPALATFEMDIMKAMGIEEDRVPAKSYWY